MRTIDYDDVGLIDVETRLHERLADAARERLAHTASTPSRTGLDLRWRLGNALIGVGTAIVATARRLEPEPEDGCQEAGGAA